MLSLLWRNQVNITITIITLISVFINVIIDVVQFILIRILLVELNHLIILYYFKALGFKKLANVFLDLLRSRSNCCSHGCEIVHSIVQLLSYESICKLLYSNTCF